jgi:hypothetical protein
MRASRQWLACLFWLDFITKDIPSMANGRIQQLDNFELQQGLDYLKTAL